MTVQDAGKVLKQGDADAQQQLHADLGKEDVMEMIANVQIIWNVEKTIA